MEQNGDQSQSSALTSEHVIQKSIENSRLSAKDAARAKEEQLAQAIKLMDDMEASAETQGQYFVKIGNKKPLTETRERPGGFFRKASTHEETVGYEDDRALILKAPIAHEYSGTQPEDYVVVTKDGLRAIRFYRNQVDNPQTGDDRDKKADYDYIGSLISGQRAPGPYSGYRTDGKWSWSKAYLAFSGESENDRPLVIVMQDLGNDQIDVFQESVKKSIDMVEAPHAQNVEKSRAETHTLQNADNIISNLPPRS